MKKFGMMVAALAIGAMATVAQAADSAWFSSSSSGVVGQGSGQALVLNVDPNSSHTISYQFTNTFNGGMAGWAFALNSGNPLATFSGGANAGLAGYDSSAGGTNGTPVFFAGQGSIPGTGAAGLAYTFTLNVGAVPFGTQIDVTGDYGPTEQYYGQGSGFAWFGSVGPNPASYGRVGYNTDGTAGWGQLPVIRVNVIPEPATLALLGLGAVALIRRRK